jgi:glycosyltransferase involved in cell wall biosynthesis
VTAPDAEVRELLRGLQGVLFFERANWHKSLLPLCRELGVISACVPNWEWFKGHDPLWKFCDIFLCTSRWTLGVVEKYGWRNTAYIGAWPMDLERFQKRVFHGPARSFFHNAGLVDPDDRKGTRDAIAAFCKLKRDDIRLVVRMQKPAELPNRDERVEVRVGNLDDPADLYRTGDVAIQPSKMEGNGFMVLEPLACGIPTLTLNYPPMNEYVRQPEMLCSLKWFKRKAFPTQWVKHAHLRLPNERDLARRIEWCAENDMAPIAAANRAWAEEMFDPSRVRRVWAEALEPLASNAGARRG